jgi:hypothetical protein
MSYKCTKYEFLLIMALLCRYIRLFDNKRLKNNELEEFKIRRTIRRDN